MGRWTLAALVLNSMIGSGIFGLPSLLAGLLGPSSRWVFLLGGAGIGVIMACLAEVASQFPGSGGPYLYARAAFGRFVGIEVGWITWLSRLAAAAASANLFVIYLAEFWPGAKATGVRLVVLTLLLGVLAAINYRGVKAGAKVSNVFMIAKLVPLTLFVGGGVAYLILYHPAMPTPEPQPFDHWAKAVMLVMFAYGGFEGAVISMGEVKDPQRSAPFALFVALAATAVIYSLVQVVVVGTLPNPAASDRPLAAAAHQFLGTTAAWVISVGAMVSVYGYLSAVILAMSRLPFALAELGDFPPFFTAIHPRFRTPHIAILVSSALLWLLSVSGSFAWNATLSVLVRLLGYGAICAALPVLRRRAPGRPRFRLPAGNVFAVLGVLFSFALVARLGRGELGIIAASFVVALINWLWARRRIAPAVSGDAAN